VQGVGFRAFVWREAAALGVAGWVRNRADGSVEAVISGDEPSLDRLLDRIGGGPRFSRVDRVDTAAEGVTAETPGGFEIRPDR
jgi:acylphosphatase